MRKVDNGETGKKWGILMLEVVDNDVVAIRLPERQPTGMLTGHAKIIFRDGDKCILLPFYGNLNVFLSSSLRHFYRNPVCCIP